MSQVQCDRKVRGVTQSDNGESEWEINIGQLNSSVDVLPAQWGRANKTALHILLAVT